MEKWKNINILFEDNHLLVVHKPANMPVCLDSSNDIDLLSKLKEYIKNKYNIEAVAHLTCISSTKEELLEALEQLEKIIY